MASKAYPGLMDAIAKRINECTRLQTQFCDAAESLDVLNQLKEVVAIPQLEDVDFYDGYRIPHHNYTPQTSQTRSELEESRGESSKRVVDLKDVFKTFNKGQITFTGPAGSGKTTLLKYISRGLLEGKYESLKNLRIVFFTQCRNLSTRHDATPGEFFFRSSDLALTDIELTELTSFIKAFPEQFIFVIDSLDTFQHDLSRLRQTILHNDSASPGVIMWNLLSGKIFPNCRIITSSREYAIRAYEGELRASKVIALNGLSDESMLKVAIGYLGEEKGRGTIEYMDAKSPALMQLCETPACLVFTLSGREMGADFVPNTMSGIMVMLFQSLQHSKYAREEHIDDVIEKLKYLSFVGTTEARVVFTTSELARFGLDIDSIAHLAILAPGGRPHKLVENHTYYLYFCHQSLQEALTAFYVAQMDLESFKNFTTDYLHSPQYAVVRRMLCGLLLDNNVLQASGPLVNAGPDLTEKRAFLKKSLKFQLGQVREDGDKLELYIALHEAMDYVRDILKDINVIELYSLPLLKSDVQAIGEILRCCTRLDNVWIYRCNFTPAMLNVLATCLAGSDVTIRFLNLTDMRPVIRDDIAALLRILPHVTDVLRIWGWKIEDADRAYLQEQINLLQPECLKIESFYGTMKSQSEDARRKSQPSREEPKRKRLTILPTGCSFDVYGCTVTVQAGSVTEPTHAEVKLVINSDLWPKGFIAVTPMLSWTPSVYLQHPATILLPAFCSANSNSLVAHVMAQATDNAEWKTAEVLAFPNSLAFEIRSKSIANHQVFVEASHLGSLIYHTRIDIHYNQQGLFSAAVYVSDKTMNDRCMSELAQQKFEEAYLMPHAMLIKGEQKCKITMDCLQPEAHTYRPNNKIAFHMDDYFAKNLRICIAFKLKPLPRPNQMLRLRYTTEYGAESDEKNEFTLQWPEAVTEIGPEGGNFEVDGCKITFPAGSVEERTHFKIARVVDSRLWPQGYLAIAPTLTCTPSMTFNRPVKVQLNTWCSPMDHDISATIMTSDGNTDAWKTTTTPTFTRGNRTIEFECTHFSRVMAFIRWILFGEVEYKVWRSIYYHPQSSNFCVVICAQDPLIKQQCKDDMRDQGFKPTPVMVNPMTMRSGDVIRISLECLNPGGFEFTSDHEPVLNVTEEFGKCLHAFHQFRLRPLPEPRQDLKIVYKIAHDVNNAPAPAFSLVWPNPGADRPVNHHNFYGPVEVDTIVEGANVHVRE